MIDLIGYDKEVNSLLENYNNKNLHNSIIFYGPKGIGKRYFVNKLISRIIKITQSEKNFHHHHNLFLNNTHPNIKIIEKETDKKTLKLKSSISIDQVRNLKSFMNSTSSINNFSKFILIDSADDLNTSSSNSLLKILEEPKKNNFIFLISHQLSSLLPTLRSRCLKIKLNNHIYEDFKKILINNIENINEEEIKLFYDLSLGSPGAAISMYNLNIIEYFDLTIKCMSSNSINEDSINLSNELSKFENDKFLSYLSVYKSLLILLKKIKFNQFDSKQYMSNKFKLLENISSRFTMKNIIDRYDFLSNNESDLFVYNLDKKTFMLRLLTH